MGNQRYPTALQKALEFGWLLAAVATRKLLNRWPRVASRKTWTFRQLKSHRKILDFIHKYSVFGLISQSEYVLGGESIMTTFDALNVSRNSVSYYFTF